MDEAEQIKSSATAIVQAKEAEAGDGEGETEEPGETTAAEAVLEQTEAGSEELSPEDAAALVEADEVPGVEGDEPSDIISDREFEPETDCNAPAAEEQKANE